MCRSNIPTSPRAATGRRAAEEIAGEIGNRIATYFIAAAKARAKAQRRRAPTRDGGAADRPW